MFFKALLFLISFAHATLISTNAGRVGDVVITSREVVINQKVESTLFRVGQGVQLQPEKVKDPIFVRETTAVLLETAIYLEAESFSAGVVPAKAIEGQLEQVKRLLRADSVWKKLSVSNDELKNILLRKRRAKDFIKFKIDSATIPITDREAEEYFNNNRLKFENLPFENFKGNIKSYLTKQQVDKRLKDWFELLNSKYRIKNDLAD